MFDLSVPFVVNKIFDTEKLQITEEDILHFVANSPIFGKQDLKMAIDDLQKGKHNSILSTIKVQKVKQFLCQNNNFVFEN